MRKLICVVFLLALSACGGGGGSNSVNMLQTPQQVGQFVDDVVAGLTYSCSSADNTQTITGTTDTDGHFNYLPGQTCTFKVGNVTLGSLTGIPTDGKVTPQDVAGVSRAATSVPSALAIAQFLQSLNDGTASGKIVIPEATTSALSNVSVMNLVAITCSVSQADLQTIAATVGKTLVSATTAKNSLDTQIAYGVVDKTSGSVSADTPAELNCISVSSATPTNSAGYTEQLTATGYYTDGTSKDLTNYVTWSSSDTNTVTVSESGLAKGLKKGNTSVIASYTKKGRTNPISGSVVQTTTDPVLVSIAVTNTANPPAGLTDQLKATGIYSDGSKLDLTQSVTWTSSDINTVNVDVHGLATGFVKGNALINASYSPSQSVTVYSNTLIEEVNDSTPLNLVISFVATGLNSIDNLTSTLLQAIVTYSNNVTKTVNSLVSWVITTINGGNGFVLNDTQNNTANLTSSAQGFFSIIASYLGIESNSIQLNVIDYNLPYASYEIIAQDLVIKKFISGSINTNSLNLKPKFKVVNHLSTLEDLSCDNSIPDSSIKINQKWLLDVSTNDQLVSLTLPKSVYAIYNTKTKNFSQCNYQYSESYFVVYGDGSISEKLDDKLGYSDSTACGNYSPLISIIPRGDKSKNISNYPIFQNLMNTGSVSNDSYSENLGICGNIRLLNYSSTNVSFIKLDFGAKLATKGNSTIAADADYVYSLTWKEGYPNGSSADDNCPIMRVKISDNSHECITVPNISNYFSYPIAASQVSNLNKFTSSDSSLFLSFDGKFSFAFSQTFVLGCGMGYCGQSGAFQPPSVFKLDGSNSTATLVTTNSQNYPYPYNYSPAGSSNRYLLLSGSGGGKLNGVLWDYSTGDIIRTCLRDITFGDNCTIQIIDKFSYGISFCGYNTSQPQDCIGTPSIGRVDTTNGQLTNWDPVALGWLPISGNGMEAAFFLPNEIIFKACPAPTLNCSNPSFVSLNYSTGLISAVASSLSDDILLSLISIY